MTYSIIARDPDTGAIGIAVASRFFACGALVPYVNATAAVASQAFVNPLWGIDGLDRLTAGEAPDRILASFCARDAGQAIRQAHMIGPDGRIAQHTGADCVPWCGGVSATNVSVAGNMLIGPDVIEDTLAAWQDAKGLSFAERFLRALEAGERAGGDKRGRQAAALVIHEGQPYPALDLRVDDDADPLSELRRLLAVAEERYTAFRAAMPTVEALSGQIDRAPLDAALDAKDSRRLAAGALSQSRATSSTH